MIHLRNISSSFIELSHTLTISLGDHLLKITAKVRYDKMWTRLERYLYYKFFEIRGQKCRL